eukprot:tig00001299_g8077.t1
MGEFDTLPDAVVVAIFKVLGLCASWPLRSVCRRFRRLIEEKEWAPASLELELDGADVCDSLVSLIEEGKLQLGSGASVSIKLYSASEHTVEDVCSLLEAITQPQKVDIEVLTGSMGWLDVDDDTDKHFLRDLVLEVLCALEPKEGATSLLESLSICLDRSSYEGEWECWPSASASELKMFLAPFGALRSLGIFVEQVRAAAVVVAACPNLRDIRLQAKTSERRAGHDWGELMYGGSDILAALAPLAFLEHAVLEYPDALTHLMDDDGSRVVVNDGLQKLAHGAAGKTLRSIYFYLHTWIICMRHLKSLSLNVASKSLATDPESIVEFLCSDVARRSLITFGLQLYTSRPLSEAEAEAIVALPALECLTISVDVSHDSGSSSRELAPQPVPPYEGRGKVAGGLRDR